MLDRKTIHMSTYMSQGLNHKKDLLALQKTEDQWQ